MPFIEIQTNQARPDDSDSLLAKVSRMASQALSKSESYVMTRWAPKVSMTFAGSSEPCAMVRVALVGSVSADARKSLAEAVTELLRTEVGIPKGRIFVTFTEVAGSHWGLGGNLFG
jgi:phenylpyruvate tautomerase PptA (4-oxalocrotonate tautomerase family)